MMPHSLGENIMAKSVRRPMFVFFPIKRANGNILKKIIFMTDLNLKV
jgi:hypothetical protein